MTPRASVSTQPASTTDSGSGHRGDTQIDVDWVRLSRDAFVDALFICEELVARLATQSPVGGKEDFRPGQVLKHKLST